MPRDNPVFVDTSVWIDYFLRKNIVLEQTLDALLENGQVATAAVIMAELIQGARGAKDTEKLKAYLKPLHWISSGDEHWEEAGKISNKLRQSGKRINLTDCYIAALADSAQSEVYTLDKHFTWIAQIGGCKIYNR